MDNLNGSMIWQRSVGKQDRRSEVSPAGTDRSAGLSGWRIFRIHRLHPYGSIDTDGTV